MSNIEYLIRLRLRYAGQVSNVEVRRIKNIREICVIRDYNNEEEEFLILPQPKRQVRGRNINKHNAKVI